MAKFKCEGLDDMVTMLNHIGQATPEIIGAAVYAMADVVADSVRAKINGLPTITDKDAMKYYAKKEALPAPSVAQKIGLKESFGVSVMRNDDGYYNVSVGFDGYNGVKTRAYPDGQPNMLVARVIERGTSYMLKHPFMRPAVDASREQAIAAGQAVFDKKIAEIKNGG